MVVFGDDVGTQKALMVGEDIWRQWIKPATAATIAAAKAVNPQVLAMYHSDGVIDPIIPELIEIGVEVLNPVQPECMDPVAVKQQYGHVLSFLGTIGTQSVMPFGTARQVRDTVARMIETVGAGGGLAIAPTHMVEPEVPLGEPRSPGAGRARLRRLLTDAALTMRCQILWRIGACRAARGMSRRFDRP